MWYVNPTALLPIATALNVYPPTLSPRTFKWEVVKFYQSPNLQQLQHFAVLLALHDCVNLPGILSHKDYFKMRWMVLMVHVAVLETQSHGARTAAEGNQPFWVSICLCWRRMQRKILTDSGGV